MCKTLLSVCAVVVGVSLVTGVVLESYHAFAAGSGTIVEGWVLTEDVEGGAVAEGTVLVITGKPGFSVLSPSVCAIVPGVPSIEILDSVAINPGQGAANTSLGFPDLAVGSVDREYPGGTRFTVLSVGTETCSITANFGALVINLTRVTLEEK